jgi:hypothetical protein
MIKAQELRIGNSNSCKSTALRVGNIVQLCFEHIRGWYIATVTDIFNDGTIKTDTHLALGKGYYFEGVELTEEWLLHFGFVIHSDYDYRNYTLLKNNFHISMWMGNGSPGGFEESGAFYWGDNYKKIQYVHQLQNLYFALVGEELTIQK